MEAMSMAVHVAPRVPHESQGELPTTEAVRDCARTLHHRELGRMYKEEGPEKASRGTFDADLLE
jgi:hypothetical protein